MDLDDLLDYHSAMTAFEQNKALSDSNKALAITYDIDLYLTKVDLNRTHIMMPFLFRTELVQISASQMLFYWQFHFTDTVSFDGDSGTSISIYIYSAAAGQTANKVTVDVKWKVGTGSLRTMLLTRDLDINTTYQICWTWLCVFSSPNYNWNGEEVRLMTLDANGFMSAGTIIFNSGYFYQNDDLPMDYLRVWVREGVDADYTFYLWEPDVYVNQSQNDYLNYMKPHRLYTSAKRRLVYTYSTYNCDKWYLIPPSNIIEGAGYDRTLVLDAYVEKLEDYVDTLETEVASLSTDVAALQTDLTNVKNQVNSGGTLYDDIISVFTTLSVGGTVYGKIAETFTNVTVGGIIYSWLDTVRTTLLSGGTIYDSIADLFSLLDGAKTIKDTIITDMITKFQTWAVGKVVSTMTAFFNASPYWVI